MKRIIINYTYEKNLFGEEIDSNFEEVYTIKIDCCDVNIENINYLKQLIEKIIEQITSIKKFVI